MKESGMPVTNKGLEKSIVATIVNDPSWGLVKPIQNEPRNTKNLIESRLTRAETGLAGSENKARFQKERTG